MKWYKHSTGSHDDPDVSDAWDELGDFGYTGFFVILEIYGNEFSHRNSDDYITISQTFLRRKLRKSWGNVELLLNFYSKRNRILSIINDSMVSIKVPKFIELASNWSKRQPTNPPTEVPLAKEVDKKKIKKKIKKQTQKADEPADDDQMDRSPLFGFEEFWLRYPRKEKKARAKKAWEKQKCGIFSDEIMALLNLQIENGHIRLDENLRYCPHPASWINDRRWEDELGIDSQRTIVYDCKICGPLIKKEAKKTEDKFIGVLIICNKCGRRATER